MRTAYSVETVRTAERALMARLPDGALMQRAAAGLAAACADLLGGVYGRLDEPRASGRTIRPVRALGEETLRMYDYDLLVV
ncbi:hypothetical protein ABZ651_16155, partial [Streptomyces sp. NPDC007070]